MPSSKKTREKSEPKQYLQGLSRRWVYGGLSAFALVVILLFLCISHYKPLRLATDNEIGQAHHGIIKQYFVVADDTTTADTKVCPENSSIDANNLRICDSLGKLSYIQQWFE